MRIIAPGRGWCCTIRQAPELTGYSLLGPFAEGTFLRRLWLMVGRDTAGHASIGASLGASGEATEEAFRAGKTLIDRSDSYLYGQTSVIVDMAAGVSNVVVLSPGVRIHSGSRFCVVMMLAAAGGQRVELIATAEMMELVKGD